MPGAGAQTRINPETGQREYRTGKSASESWKTAGKYRDYVAPKKSFWKSPFGTAFGLAALTVGAGAAGLFGKAAVGKAAAVKKAAVGKAVGTKAAVAKTAAVKKAAVGKAVTTKAAVGKTAAAKAAAAKAAGSKSFIGKALSTKLIGKVTVGEALAVGGALSAFLGFGGVGGGGGGGGLTPSQRQTYQELDDAREVLHTRQEQEQDKLRGELGDQQKLIDDYRNRPSNIPQLLNRARNKLRVAIGGGRYQTLWSGRNLGVASPGGAGARR